MSTYAVIAVRGGPSAKSRCAAALGPDEREGLVVAMIEDMLAALGAAGSIDHIHLVTPTAALAALADRRGAQPLIEQEASGFNAALDAARRRIAQDDPGALILLLPGDLPLIDPDEIDRLIAAHRPGQAVIVPADGDGGTGALLVAATDDIELCFGPDSAAAHAQAAGRAGLDAVSVSAPSLAFDIDSPTDLGLACRRGGDSHSGRYLRGLRLPEEFAAR